MNRLFSFFEAFAQPFRPSPGSPPAGGGLVFIHHFVRQMPLAFLAMLVLGGLTALVEAALFMFVGVIVDLIANTAAEAIWQEHGTKFLFMAGLVIIGRALNALMALLEEQVVVPGFFTLVRWQSHRAVARQDVGFFDDELAGRVSGKIWQSGQAAGDVMVSLLQIIWFIVIFAATTLVVVAGLDWRLMVPVLVWIMLVGCIAAVFVPRIRERGRSTAEAGSSVTGRMVDGYSNIRLVKLHNADAANDTFIKASFSTMLARLKAFTRAISGMRIASQFTSALMLIVIAGTALNIYSEGGLSVGSVAVVLALCLRLNLLLNRLLGLLNGLFRNFGTVQNSAEVITRQPTIVDAVDAVELPAARGEIEFREVSFSYTKNVPVFDGLNLRIAAGERVGLIGPSGAGKSTLINLLLRFYDRESGSIRIDDLDIAKITQSSLRHQFGVVTQDTALLHRSIRDNIAYGDLDADDNRIEAAARRAHAHDFIMQLEDVKGRRGYDTHVGERGVKLSGGQRQRIAIARIFLRDAPVLLLDEATSALDSEIEAAIQDHLEQLMSGKTVLAVAHRLSTIAHMERLIVIEDGAIVEEGSHAQLLARNGVYARLWERQSGGFLLAG